VKNKKTKWLLFFIFLLGAVLRLAWLDKFPAGLTPDEAAQGYSAYSILKTGKDEWGVKLPLNLRSFGDFKPSLQTYLMIPSVAVLGLTKIAVRLPNALLGSLAIIGVFYLVWELFKKEGLALLAAFLLSISPWHIPLSRGAFEANLTVFFISSGAYFLLRSYSSEVARRDSSKCVTKQVLAALFLGLNMFSYHSAKLMTPLIILSFAIYYLRFSKIKIKKFIIHHSLFIILYSLFFIVAFASFFQGGQTRGADIAVFNPTDNWQAVADERWWGAGVGLPDLISRIFHNKLSYSLSQFSKNYLSYLSFDFLFINGPGEGTYGMIPGRGVLWWWQLLVLAWVFYQLARKPNKKALLVIFLVLFSPLAAALAKGARAANRVAVMMPWIQILLAWGLWKLKIKSEKLKILGVFIIFIFFLFFLEDYFVQSPRKIGKQMLFGRCKALEWAEAKRAEQIIVSRKLSEPQAYVMFCLGLEPELVQKETPNWLRYESEGLGFVDQLGEYCLDKFLFKEINWASDSLEKNTVLLGVPEEFPSQFKPDEIVFYPNKQAAIFGYSTDSKQE